MKKLALAAAALWVAFFDLHAQSVVNVVGTVPGQAVDVKSGGGSVLTSLPVRKAPAQGDVYLSRQWVTADVVTSKGGENINEIPVRVNLYQNEIEILYKNQIKALPGSLVSELIFKLPNGKIQKFLNADSFLLDSATLSGFLEQISPDNEGKWCLYLHPELKLVESNYNIALDMGSRSDRFEKRETVLLANEKSLYKLNISRKKFFKHFPGNEERVRKFVKENKLDFRLIHHLNALVDFLNQNNI